MAEVHGGLGNVLFRLKNKQSFLVFTAENGPRPRPDVHTPRAGTGDSANLVHKLAFSVLMCAHLPGESSHERHFVDQIAPSPKESWITAPTGLFPGFPCFFLRFPTDGFVLANKSTIRVPEALRNAEAKGLIETPKF